MSLSFDHLIRTLESYPQGVTAKDLSARMGTKLGTLRGRLSHYYIYGKIDREMVKNVPQQRRGPRFQYLYRVKGAADHA